MKCVLSILIFICASAFSFGQEAKETKNSSTIYIGYPGDYFDSPDLGLYVGYNYQFSIRPRFSWEAQASFSYSKFDRDDSLFGHNGGEKQGVVLLCGPRLYLSKASRRTRLYINLLAGLAYFAESEFRNNGPVEGPGGIEILFEENIAEIGYSLGAYLEFNDKFVIGTSFESRTNQVVKIGLKF